MAVYRINKTRLAELVDKTIKYVVEADLKDVTSIRYFAFYNCPNLTSITIPASVTSIGNFAFSGCTSLTEMTVLATTPPNLSNTNAISTATTVIYVPAGSLSAYQTATNWSGLASKMVGV